jgi:putative transport protein
VLFVYCVGLTSGPGFFTALRSRGLWLNAGALLALIVGAGCSAAAGRLLGLDAGYVAGLFSGALTNTPALGAVAERLRGSELAAHAALAYSVSYPFGVFGAVLLLRGFAAHHKKALAELRERLALTRQNELATRNFEISNPEIVGRSIGELRVRDVVGVLLSRVGRAGESLVPTKYTLMQRGDVVTAVGPKDALASAEPFFGALSTQHLEASREHVDMRRILVSRRELVGAELGELDLERRFNAQVTRVRRADLDLLPSAATRLQLGDRLRVVAPVARMPQLNEFFGDSERELSEIDMLALALGLTLGLLLSKLPLPLPGGSLTLGIAGGPLLVGLVLGYVGRSGRLVWSIPQEASTTLRELGLLIFLAAVGVSAGGALRTVALVQGVKLFAAGALVTLATSSVALWSFSRWGRADAIQSLGACSGTQTQPATLAVAHEISGHSEQTYVAYAIVYPMAMVAKILLAQLLAW